MVGCGKEKIMDIITKCPICKSVHPVHLTREQGLRYGDYRAGKDMYRTCYRICLRMTESG